MMGNRLPQIELEDVLLARVQGVESVQGVDYA